MDIPTEAYDYDSALAALRTFEAAAAAFVTAADNLGNRVQADGLRDPETITDIAGITNACMKLRVDATAAVTNLQDRHANPARAAGAMPVEVAETEFYGANAASAPAG